MEIKIIKNNTYQKNHFYFIIVFFLFISGCINNNARQEKENYNYSIDTIKIAINDNYLQTYNFVQGQKLGERLYTYSPHLNSIDIFDIKDKKSLFQISMEREGPNGVIGVNAFNVTPSFFILDDQHQYIIINYKGEIQKRIKKDEINSLKEFNEYLITFPVSITNFETQTFDKERNELIIPIFPKNTDDYKNKKSLACFNIETEEVKILPVPYPEIFDKYSFGLLSKPYIMYKGDSIIYNYPMSSSIYIYDQNTQETIEKKVDSYFTQNLSEKLNEKNPDLVTHFLQSTSFHGVKYDPYRNLYYRFHVNKINKNDDIRKREKYLTLIDSDFNKIEEYRLQDNTSQTYYITPEGLLFEFMIAPFENDYALQLITSDIIQSVSWPEYEKVSMLTKQEENNEPEPVILKEEDFFDINVLSYANDVKGFVYDNLVYPAEEYENKTEGIVFVSLKRDEKGYIIDYSIVDLGKDDNITENMKEESLRIAKLIKRINPQEVGEILGFSIDFSIAKYNQRHKL